MAKKNLATGIDIGTASVKVVTLDWTDRGKVEVRRATKCEVDLPPLPPTSEEMRRLQAAALKKALSEHRIARGTVVTAIPREDAVIRYLSLPSVKDEEIDEMLNYDVERHVPFSLDQMEMDYKVIGRRGDAESEIMLVAAPDDRMNDHLEILEMAGIESDVIDVSILGTCQSYMNGSPLNRVRAVMNIGRQSTEIGLFREGVVRYSRSLPMGLARLHEMLKEHGIPSPEPFPNFERLGGPDGPVKMEWIRRLVMELSRTLQAFRHESHNPPPDIIILCGGMAGAPGLSDRLTRELGIRTEILPPLLPDSSPPALPPPPQAATTPMELPPVYDLPEQVAPVSSMVIPAAAAAEPLALDEFTGVKPPVKPKVSEQPTPQASSSVAVSPMPEFATAAGLAMRAARAGDQPLNLLPERIVRSRGNIHQKRFLQVCSILFIIIALEGAGVLGLKLQEKIARKNELLADIQRIDPKIREIKEAAEELKRIDEYRDAENSFYKILHDVYLRTNEGVQYTDILFTKQKDLRLQGVVYTQEAANMLRKFIAEDSKYFSDVSIPVSRVVPPGVPTIDKNMTVVQFEMLCKLKSAETRANRRGGR